MQRSSRVHGLLQKAVKGWGWGCLGEKGGGVASQIPIDCPDIMKCKERVRDGLEKLRGGS